jgi:hypothetical protein
LIAIVSGIGNIIKFVAMIHGYFGRYHLPHPVVVGYPSGEFLESVSRSSPNPTLNERRTPQMLDKNIFEADSKRGGKRGKKRRGGRHGKR